MCFSIVLMTLFFIFTVGKVGWIEVKLNFDLSVKNTNFTYEGNNFVHTEINNLNLKNLL